MRFRWRWWRNGFGEKACPDGFIETIDVEGDTAFLHQTTSRRAQRNIEREFPTFKGSSVRPKKKKAGSPFGSTAIFFVGNDMILPTRMRPRR